MPLALGCAVFWEWRFLLVAVGIFAFGLLMSMLGKYREHRHLQSFLSASLPVSTFPFPLPKIKLSSSHGFPGVHVVFSSEEALDSAKASAGIEHFKAYVQAYYAAPEDNRPFDVERAFSISINYYDGWKEEGKSSPT